MTSTQLLAASRDGDAAAVRALLSDGVDVNVRDDYGWSPFEKAAYFGHADVVELLLAANAHHHIARPDGKTPLQDAAMNGHVRVVDELLKAKVDPNVADENGHTALHKASSYGHFGVVEKLLNAHADPSIVNMFGRTPLHHASMWHRSDLVRLFLAHGCDPRAPDNEGLASLHLCITKNGKSKINKDTLSTLQELVSVGVTWDAKCDELISSGKARKGAPALRSCVLLWSQEHADGLELKKMPIEVLRRGEKTTQNYINQLKSSKKTKLRRKLCIVGPSKAGKTSLIKSLTTLVPSLVHPDDRTIGVDQTVLRFEVQEDGKTVIYEVTFWDFAGQNEYHVAHSLFFSKRTLYLVCVDMEAFLVAHMQADLMGHTGTHWERLMNEFIERDVLRWVRVIFTRQPDAEFVFIATKSDLMTEYPKYVEAKTFLETKLEQVEGIVREMKREVLEQASENERRADMLTLYAYQKRVEEREARDQQAPVLDFVDGSVLGARGQETSMGESTSLLGMFAGWRRSYTQLISSVKGENADEENDKVIDHSAQEEDFKPVSLFISCADRRSVNIARDAIIALIVKSGRSFAMPQSYTSVLKEIVKMREAAAHSGGDARVARTFAPIDTLVDSLVAKVSEIDSETCRGILQTLHDLGDVLWYEDLGIAIFEKNVILDPLLLIDFVRQVINHNHNTELLAHAVLKGLPFWVNLQSEELFLAMKQVLQKFQLVHSSEGEMKWNSDLIVPAFWNSKTPASWLFGYEDVRLVAALPNSDPNTPKEQVRIHWEYHFAHEFPDALFDHLVVATHSPYMKRDAGPDWIMYAEDGVFACRTMLARAPETLERVLHLEAVLVEGADDDQASELWEAFETLSEGIVKVLRQYPGLVVIGVALDDQLTMRDLEGLFGFPLKHQSRKWMPRVESWEFYKQVVEQGNVEDDDTWVLIDE